MNYNIFLSDNFKKEFKRLYKKFPSLKSDIEHIAKDISKSPKIGVYLDDGVYKIRVSIASNNKGKSRGARIIYFIKIHENKIYFLSIYIKSEKNTISNKEIKELLKEFL